MMNIAVMFPYFTWQQYISGDIRQYDITDPANPKLVGQLYISGSAVKGGNVTILDENIMAGNRAYSLINSIIFDIFFGFESAGTDVRERSKNLRCSPNDPVNT